MRVRVRPEFEFAGFRVLGGLVSMLVVVEEEEEEEAVADKVDGSNGSGDVEVVLLM